MNTFLRVLFFAVLVLSGLSVFFSHNNALESEHPQPKTSRHKVSKVEVPKPPPKSEPHQRVKKALAPEKPSTVTTSPFSGLKSFGRGGSSGLISQADQQASAANSFSNSKSSQTTDIQILSQTEPLFPDGAKKKNVTGYVRLEITIDQSSTVKSVDVLSAEPEGYFEAAAIEAVRNWKFTAAYQNGKPIESSIKRRIEFKLE